MRVLFSEKTCRWQVVSVSSVKEIFEVEDGNILKMQVANWNLGCKLDEISFGSFQRIIDRTQTLIGRYQELAIPEAPFNFYRLSYSSDGNKSERLSTSVRTTSYSPEAGCLSCHVFPVGSGDRRQQMTLGGQVLYNRASDELVRFQGRVHRGLKARQGEQGGAASQSAVLLLFWTVLRSPLRDFSSRPSDPIFQGALDALEHTVRSCGEKVSFRSPAPESGSYFLQGDVKNSLPCLPLPRS